MLNPVSQLSQAIRENTEQLAEKMKYEKKKSYLKTNFGWDILKGLSFLFLFLLFFLKVIRLYLHHVYKLLASCYKGAFGEWSLILENM